MKRIEIFAYTMINGDSHYNSRFKNLFVDSLSEVEAFEKRIERYYRKKYEGECKVYAVYKWNTAEWETRPE